MYTRTIIIGDPDKAIDWFDAHDLRGFNPDEPWIFDDSKNEHLTFWLKETPAWYDPDAVYATTEFIFL